jgi:hypothetical protein
MPRLNGMSDRLFPVPTHPSAGQEGWIAPKRTACPHTCEAARRRRRRRGSRSTRSTPLQQLVTDAGWCARPAVCVRSPSATPSHPPLLRILSPVSPVCPIAPFGNPNIAPRPQPRPFTTLAPPLLPKLLPAFRPRFLFPLYIKGHRPWPLPIIVQPPFTIRHTTSHPPTHTTRHTRHTTRGSCMKGMKGGCNPQCVHTECLGPSIPRRSIESHPLPCRGGRLCIICRRITC